MNEKQINTKRVCIIRQKHYPMQRNLRRNAENLIKNGYDVDVICCGLAEQPKHEIQDGVNIHRVYYSYHRDSVFWYLVDYFCFFMLVSFYLTRLSLKKRFDVIEICNVPDFLVFASLLPKLMGSKVIFNVFEKTESLFATSFGLSRKHIFTRLINLINRMCVHYADHVIFTDVVVHQRAIDEFGLDPDKTTLILNVPDESVFSLAPIVESNDNNCFKVTIVSSILKRYGIQTVIEAVPLLVEKIPELKIDIVGDGNYLPYLKKMAHDTNVHSKINFTEWLPYEEVSAYIARADICVCPTVDDVGTPNKILEYFALGKATVSSVLPGLKALIDDGCLLYYQPGNVTELVERIMELYHSPEKRDTLGQSAREFYEKYRWPVMIRRYLKVYELLCSR